VNLPRRNAILAVSHLPHSQKPLIQTDRRVFKDRPDLDGELSFGMASLALPEAPRRQKTDLLGTSDWTHDAIFPAPIRQIVNAVLWIREVNDCFLKGLWFGCDDESSITGIV
jgi:hypothetical protein